MSCLISLNRICDNFVFPYFWWRVSQVLSRKRLSLDLCDVSWHQTVIIGFREEDSRGVISFPSHHVSSEYLLSTWHRWQWETWPQAKVVLLDFYFAKLLLFPLITLLIGKQVTKCILYWRWRSLIPIKLECVLPFAVMSSVLPWYINGYSSSYSRSICEKCIFSHESSPTLIII